MLDVPTASLRPGHLLDRRGMCNHIGTGDPYRSTVVGQSKSNGDVSRNIGNRTRRRDAAAPTQRQHDTAMSDRADRKHAFARL